MNMAEETAKKPAKAEETAGKGGFGGAAKYVPTAAEVAEANRVHADLEANK